MCAVRPTGPGVGLVSGRPKAPNGPYLNGHPGPPPRGRDSGWKFAGPKVLGSSGPAMGKETHRDGPVGTQTSVGADRKRGNGLEDSRVVRCVPRRSLDSRLETALMPPFSFNTNV